MKFRVDVICVREDGAERRRDVMEMERDELAMETLGLSLAEGEAILRGVQDFIASQQTLECLERQRNCPHCGQRYHSKETGTSIVETVFGPVAVPHPRWERCSCQTEGPKTFRPTATWLKGRTSPERLYLETKWGVTDSLREGRRFIERSAAGSRFDQLRNGAGTSPSCCRVDGGGVGRRTAAHKEGCF
jgi:hypothetical protein